MSHIQELYEKVSKDATLQEKFSVIIKDAEVAGEDAKGRLVTFAKDAGYDITVEEMREYFKALAEPKEGELSDIELDQVAGGKSETGQVRTAISIMTAGLACAASSLANYQNSGTWDLCANMLD